MPKNTRTQGPASRAVMAPDDARNGPRPGDTVRSPLGFGRETVESIVVAFTLALLFRAFEAEAFVIPTGSMAPTLMGRHKDLTCDSCGLEYRVGCSAEEDDQSQGLRMELARLEQDLATQRSILAASSSSPRERDDARSRIAALEGPQGPIAQRRERLSSKLVSTAKCPNCGLVTRLVRPRGQALEYDPRYPSFSGDRILVNKFAYDLRGPDRWDVVVFRYPEDAKVNYIKRLVGLPGETVSIAGGDIWTSRDDGPPQIARKPPRKMLAMLQCVHDSSHVSAELRAAGWPLAWSDWSAPNREAACAWTTDDDGRSYTVACEEDASATLRYRHALPTEEQWAAARRGESLADAAAPSLITDFQPYNALAAKPHWVGDLAVGFTLESRAVGGQLSLDLVEAGTAHRCTFDLVSGEARLAIAGGAAEDAPRARTRVRGRGSWAILFANVDDELSLFIDGAKVEFDRPAIWTRSIEDAQSSQPYDGEIDPGMKQSGDLAPVGITATAASLSVRDLRVLRDVFYLTTVLGARAGEFLERGRLDFPLEEGQFFVLGDNSAASKDSRLWSDGHHVDRHLLIGEALVVFWPHAIPAAWNIPVKIGGMELRLPSWPNFARMRAVR